MQILGLTILSALLLLVPCTVRAETPERPAAHSKRIALVVGNANYQLRTKNAAMANPVTLDTPQRLRDLANPIRDAQAVAQTLRSNGIDVLEGYDLDFRGFSRIINQFAERAESAEEALVFYAGHGMKITRRRGRHLEEVNVLLPVDAEISCNKRDDALVIAMEELMKSIEGVAKQVFIFDACRDDPFQYCPGRSSATGTGFDRAALPAVTAQGASSIIIAYSTGEGKVASDGAAGEHSPFASSLLGEMRDNTMAVWRELLELTSEKVAEKTKGAQVPAIIGTGSRPDSCLAGKDCLTTAALIAKVAQEAERARSLSEGLLKQMVTAEEQRDRAERVLCYLTDLQKFSDAQMELRRVGKLPANSPSLPIDEILAKKLLRLPIYGKPVVRFGDSTRRGNFQGVGYESIGLNEIRSPVDSWVIFSGDFRTYGLIVILNLGGGYHLLLANLDKVHVTTGALVYANQLVGRLHPNKKSETDLNPIGNPILYFELKKDGRNIDPMQYIQISDQSGCIK